MSKYRFARVAAATSQPCGLTGFELFNATRRILKQDILFQFQLIFSGIHAREWISPATGTWMLNELVENDINHPELTDGLDWYFLL